MQGIHVSIIIALIIIIIAHLTVDRDMPQNLKTGAWSVFAILGIIYLIFGIF